MKPLHLSVSACLISLAFSSANAGLFELPRNRAKSLFAPVSNVQAVFRGQSEGVPLPPGALGIPGAATTQPGTFVNPQTYNNSGGVTPAGGFMVPGATAPMYQSGPQTVDGTGQLTIPESSTWNAFSPPILPDPFAPGQGYAQPYAPNGGYGANPYGANAYGGTAGAFSTYGANGAAPYRMGWQNNLSVEWLAGSGTSGNATGSTSQFGVDYDLAYTSPWIPGWMFTWTNQFRLRNWQGPATGPGLPGAAYRLGWDFELATPKAGPVSLKLGVTPSINTDFEGSIGSDAFQLDGRAAFIFEVDQYWSLVLGAAYWDRVENIVLPYVGMVYQDDFWEWRLMFPESMVSVFLGNEALGAKWAYARAEYHVEAFEVRTARGGSDEIQLEDARLMLGFRMDSGLYSWFTEAGWVVGRTVDYGLPTNGSFNQNTTALIRMGVSY